MARCRHNYRSFGGGFYCIRCGQKTYGKTYEKKNGKKAGITVGIISVTVLVGTFAYLDGFSLDTALDITKDIEDSLDGQDGPDSLGDTALDITKDIEDSLDGQDGPDSLGDTALDITKDIEDSLDGQDGPDSLGDTALDITKDIEDSLDGQDGPDSLGDTALDITKDIEERGSGILDAVLKNLGEGDQLTPFSTTEETTEHDVAGSEATKWKSYMLELINAERNAMGLDPVIQGDNPAAQIHADNMLYGCFSSHWGLDGLKPYMRYSIVGGYQHNAENISGLNYCIEWGNYVTTSPGQDIREAMDGFMQSPGHRDAILDPHNAKVNLGLAWDDYNMMVVQHFEYDYVVFEEPPAIRDGVLSFSGTALNGASFRSADDLTVQIYYDPPPYNLTPGQIARTYCYDLGTVAVALVPPPSPGSYYTTSSYHVTTTPCPNPYDVPADAPVPASYDQAHAMWRQSYLDSMSAPAITLTVPFQSATEWSVSGDDFAVEGDIKSLLQERGPGVYTIVVWGIADGEGVVISERSVFYQVDLPGGYG